MRTDPTKVRAALNTSAELDVSNAIRTANAVTNHVVNEDTDGLLGNELPVEIETYLAAHFYALFDPQYRSKSTGDASASFILGQEGKRFEATPWGQQAIACDITGTLAAMNEGSYTVEVAWLGLPFSEKTEWQDRN